jgi:hypothetical protein
MKSILYHIETHSIEGIREYFEQGGSPNELYDGLPLFTWMIEMYTRSPHFKDCIKVFIDHGLVFENEALLAVFAQDIEKLQKLIQSDVAIINQTFSRFNNTYTPLTGGTLLHYCAEFNSAACAEILIQHSADVNAKTAIDEHGFGGHTPIFHTVNQNGNNSFDMLNLLLKNGADLEYTVKGLIWGKGYEWETFIPSVNPISYAMMGLLPQMHRKEVTITEVVSLLVKHAYGIIIHQMFPMLI